VLVDVLVNLAKTVVAVHVFVIAATSVEKLQKTVTVTRATASILERI